MKNYVRDSSSIYGDVGKTVASLQQQGWKDLRIQNFNSWGDCRADRIEGYRPMTKEEISEETKEKRHDEEIRKEIEKNQKKSEIREMLKLAKKHGFSVVKVNVVKSKNRRNKK